MSVIPTPSTNEPPKRMTKEEVEQVRREKRMDDETRKQLEQLYGPSRAGQRQRIHLTRLEKQRQICPQCKRKSADARRVCEYCVQPENGTLTRDVMNATAANRNSTALSTQQTKKLLAPSGSSAQRHPPASQMQILTAEVPVLSTNDPRRDPAAAPQHPPRLHPTPGGGVMRLTIPHTQRCYRVVTAEVRDEGGYYRLKNENGNAAALTSGSKSAAATTADEDEPDCGIQDRGYGGVDEDEKEEVDDDDEINDEMKRCTAIRSEGNTAAAAAPPAVPPPAPSSSSAAQAPASSNNPAAVPFAPFALSTALGKAAASAPGELPRRNPNKADFTHFVAIPIGRLPEVKDQLGMLVECMMDVAGVHQAAETGSGGGQAPHHSSHNNASAPITKELFNTVERMHLTLLLLSLHTREEVQLAKDLLKAFGDAWLTEKKKLWQSDEMFRKHCRCNNTNNNNNNNNNNNAKNGQQCSSSSASHDAAAARPMIRLGGLYVMPSRQQQEHHKRLQNKHHQNNATNDLTASVMTLPYQELQKGVDLSNAGVVFMGLDDTHSLQMVRRIQDLLHRVFAELLMDLEDEANASKELIHMTILNKKWRAGPAKRPFDATELLSIFGQSQIGASEVERLRSPNSYDGFAVDEVVLCRLSSTSMGGPSHGKRGGGSHGKAATQQEAENKAPYVREAVVSL